MCGYNPGMPCWVCLQDWLKKTDSPNSLPDKVVVKVIMNGVLQWRLLLIMYSDVKYQIMLINHGALW